ncbi:MAG TPA: 30S ribosomal protein S9 [Patescibacteria group bacterium]|nr:30S ribosomal protein S9 [Patescibacteria group bacterium]
MITATGKRKSAIARVWLLSPGSGEIKVNDKKVEEFFPNLETKKLVIAPLEVLKKQKDFDWNIKVQGGGFKGQARATQLGIARALEKFNSDWRKELKDEGFLSRDARVKERKKPGLKRARRAPQWKKR